ncbi:hypothetical protein P8C59_009415 [Phyllachora maydis]|uniref:Mediator of RNA polymerase II transcription subunit 17 n=1 Tax=Phyllachora maydis TaxID=1825666 RepID=A0AAD9IEC7_9PEZI|nr:hypothetical protein P8C59_009415 [Phyllachora maydis]
MSSSLALRAPPSAGRGPKNLGEFIARMQAQPGGFRAINQDELRARIAAKQRGDAEDEDEDTEDADDDADRKAPTIRELLGTRDEMFMNAEIAHQQGLFALDFISLLLSKQNPAFARETLSPGLRDLVGIGTLGTTILENPTTLMQERVAEFKEMEMGRRLLDLQSMASNLQAQEALSNPLLDLFPSLVPGEPSPAYAVIGQADAHYSQDNLVWYVENALPRALAARYMGMVQRQEATDSEPDDGWVLRIDRAGICNRETEQYGVSFNVVTNGGNTELQAVAILPQDGTTQTVEWSWTAEGGRQDQQPTLDEVVQKVLGSKLVPAQCA